MAQYEIDFEGLTLDTYPAGLTRRWNTSQPQPLVKATPSAALGFSKELRHQRSSSVRELNSLNALDADVDRATVKGRVLVYSGSGATSTSTPLWLGAVRCSGAAASENGYIFTLTRSSGYRLGINAYKGGTQTESYSSSTTAWAQSTYYVAEWEVSGTSPVELVVRLYALSDLSTPIATHTRTDSSSPITSAGWVGLGGFASVSPVSHLYMAVATGASELPVAPWDVPAEDPISFSGTVPAQSFAEDSAITPLDLSTYFSGDLTPFSYAVTTGTLPTGLSLNGSTGVISGTPTTPAAAVSLVVTATDDESNTAATNAFNVTITEAVAAPVLREDYERSSVNLSGSSVSGTGDDAVITIKPRVQWSEVASGTTKTRWLEPSVRIDGVDGIRPSFKFIDYAPTATAGTMVGAPYPSTRRPMFSYDRLTWHYFDTTTVTSTEIQFRHDTAFTGDTIYVGRSRQRSVAQVGDWLETIAAAHPTKIAPTPAAAAFTPTLTSWPAQSFIAGEFSTQTDELGRTIPQTPFWAFEINDTALGGSKRLAVMYCGVHAGEDHASHVFERAVEYLLGSSAEAVALRTHYRVVIYPMLNAPGRAGGGWRGSFTLGTGGADDPNRHFGAIDGLEIVSIPRAALATDIASVVPDWMLDWHGTYINNYSLFINRANQTEFQSRAAAASGFTVGNEGTLTSDCVEQYFYATLGTPFVATLEHGDKNPQTDANLITWAEAVIDTMESMRADGYFYTVAETAGEVAALSLSAPAGTTAASTSASGTPQTLSLSAPAGDATTASTTFASGNLAALSIAAPNGTSAAQAAVSAGIQALSITAPAGDASSASTTFASGDVAPVSLAAPAGTTAQSTASSGAVQHIILTAPNGNASTVAETLASGAVAGLTLTPSDGAQSVSTAATGAPAGITLLAVEGDANTLTYTLVEGDLAPITLTAPEGVCGVDVAGQGAMAGITIVPPTGRGFDPTAAGETTLGYATRTREGFVVTRTKDYFVRAR